MAAVLRVVPPAGAPSDEDAGAADVEPGAVRRRGIPVVLVFLWMAAAVVSIAFVLYGFEPLFQQRQQSALLARYRTTLHRAAAAAADPIASAASAQTPRRGQPVALLEIQALGLQQVVLEGVRPRQTQEGPGHVPGTPAPGQPGNAVVVGRQAMFGGPFRSLAKLHVGDGIVVTTTQGQSTYRVESNRALDFRRTSARSIEGPSSDDRLTLVTSASRSPVNADRARVVVAHMEHAAFAPTKQGKAGHDETGAGTDAGGWLAAFFGFAIAAAACVAAVWCYIHLSSRTAYLITAVPLVVIIVLASEWLSRVVPAWL